MRGILGLGVVLVVVGAAMLGYGHFTYKTQEKILEVGPIKATAERTTDVSLPPVIAWALIGSGACVLLTGVLGRRI